MSQMRVKLMEGIPLVSVCNCECDECNYGSCGRCKRRCGRPDYKAEREDKGDV